MSDPPTGVIHEQLLPVKSIRTTARKRLNEHMYEQVNPALLTQYQDGGWVVDKMLKRWINVRKPKPPDIAFEDRVWGMFALDFPAMNADRRFVLPYGSAPNETKQLDVFAADDEVVLIVECKSTSTPAVNAFKSEIEAIQGTRGGLVKTIRREFPKRRIKFVLATSNYVLSAATAERIAAADIAYLDEDAVDYYIDLAKHFGKAARFQMLDD